MRVDANNEPLNVGDLVLSINGMRKGEVGTITDLREDNPYTTHYNMVRVLFGDGRYQNKKCKYIQHHFDYGM